MISLMKKVTKILSLRISILNMKTCYFSKNASRLTSSFKATNSRLTMTFKKSKCYKISLLVYLRKNPIYYSGLTASGMSLRNCFVSELNLESTCTSNSSIFNQMILSKKLKMKLFSIKTNSKAKF